jgi:SAM-dependent methyltransferase
MENISEFRKAQEKNLKNVRGRTERTSPDGNYGVLRTSLEEYERHICGKKSILDMVKKKRKAHPERPVAILDFGCGENHALRDLREKASDDLPIELTGWSVGDPRKEEDRAFDEAHTIKFIDQKNVTETPPPDSYDFIFSFMAFLHLPNPLQTLKKLYNALRDDGELFVDIGPYLIEGKFVDDGDFYSLAGLHTVMEDMKKAGIDVESDKKHMVIRKNDKALKFPSVTFSDEAKYNIKAGVYEIKKGTSN